MNGLAVALDELKLIVSGLQEIGDEVDAVICPPATLIAAAVARAKGSRLQIGAQDCSQEKEGAFTGDVAAAMIADSDAHFVIVGHSERRQGRGETNHDILRKIEQCIALAS